MVSESERCDAAKVVVTGKTNISLQIGCCIFPIKMYMLDAQVHVTQNSADTLLISKYKF